MYAIAKVKMVMLQLDLYMVYPISINTMKKIKKNTTKLERIVMVNSIMGSHIEVMD